MSGNPLVLFFFKVGDKFDKSLKLIIDKMNLKRSKVFGKIKVASCHPKITQRKRAFCARALKWVGSTKPKGAKQLRMQMQSTKLEGAKQPRMRARSTKPEGAKQPSRRAGMSAVNVGASRSYIWTKISRSVCTGINHWSHINYLSLLIEFMSDHLTYILVNIYLWIFLCC